MAEDRIKIRKGEKLKNKLKTTSWGGGERGKEIETGDILAVVNATVDSAESATSKDGLDDELRGVDLPVLSGGGGGGSGGGGGGGEGGDGGGGGGGVILFLLVLVHGPYSVKMLLQLLIQALEINLICPHKPITALLHFFSSSGLCEENRIKSKSREESNDDDDRGRVDVGKDWRIWE